MSKRPKVNRSFYRKLTQSELSVFVQALVDNTKDVEEYKDLVNEVLILEEKTTTYTQALQAATQGGRDRVLTKDLAKKEVLTAFDNLASGMDFFSKGNIDFFTLSGVELQNEPVKYTGDLIPPINFSAAATGVPGIVELKYEIDLEQKPSVNSVGVEWSIDNGTTWQNGKYSTTKSRMTLTGMPSRELVMIKIRCLGTRERLSDWTTPITVSVS